MEKRKLLNLGCGNRWHDDWINLDFVSRNKKVIACNLLEGIPFPNNYFDTVYHSHLLEHFSKKNALKFIEECYGILKTGGIIRVVVPNLESIVENYKKYLELVMDGDKIEEANYDWTMIEMYDQCVRKSTGGEMRRYLDQDNIINKEFINSRIGSFANFLKKPKITNKNKLKIFIKKIILSIRNLEKFIPGERNRMLGKFMISGEIHQWMYDRFSLLRLLRDAGFKDPVVTNAYNSMIDGWSKFNLDTDKDGQVFKPDSLYMEAVK